MPPIGERFTDKPIMNTEQLGILKIRQNDIVRKIDSVVPLIRYVSQHHTGAKSNTLVSPTRSATAQYETDGRIVQAVVNRTPNNELTLRAYLISIDSDGYIERKEGLRLGVSQGSKPGQLVYSGFRPVTYEQHFSAFDNIEETISLIEDANTAIYGVRNFEGLSMEEVKVIHSDSKLNLKEWAEKESLKKRKIGRSVTRKNFYQ